MEIKEKTIYIAFIIIIVFIVLGSYRDCSRKETQEQNIPKQYIEEQRDKIKLKVTTIDSLQHEKVIEVQGLSNDSTLELFYKLVRE